MSLFVPKFDETVLVREAEAEVVGRAPTTVRLLADSSRTGGALSTQRVTLTAGADGAKPHWHDNSAEMFFLLDGAAEILSGDDVVTAGPGDLVVVPPGKPHAFAAVPGADADLLIVITPGVERFEYFRHLQRITIGEATVESLLEVQELYDNHFMRSEVWDGRRR
ncbi:cupin domain-containing protein [Streptomyces coerulescens]|uniref:Cupin domain-containing protein n=1 Tax=Streptomyces coerulescens TaxID=29304 RepID=A0ABW0CKC8_STRCD